MDDDLKFREPTHIDKSQVDPVETPEGPIVNDNVDANDVSEPKIRLREVPRNINGDIVMRVGPFVPKDFECKSLNQKSV